MQKTNQALLKKPTSSNSMSLTTISSPKNFYRSFSTKIHDETSPLLKTNGTKAAKKKNNMYAQDKAKYIAIIYNVKKRQEKKNVKALKSMVMQPSVIALPPSKKNVEKRRAEPYALRSRRMRRKVKKLGLIKQQFFRQKARPLVRRFLTQRLFIKNIKTPQLLSVRRSQKLYNLKKTLINTRIIATSKIKLHGPKKLRYNTVGYTLAEKKLSLLRQETLESAYSSKRVKFTQR